MALLLIFGSGSLGLLGFVVQKKQTRVVCWLLAGLLLSGAGVMVSVDVASVEAFTFDPGTLPDCPAGQGSHESTIRIIWQNFQPSDETYTVDVYTTQTLTFENNTLEADEFIITTDIAPSIVSRLEIVNADLTGFVGVQLFVPDGSGGWQPGVYMPADNLNFTSLTNEFTNGIALFTLFACETEAACNVPTTPTATPTFTPTHTALPPVFECPEDNADEQTWLSTELNNDLGHDDPDIRAEIQDVLLADLRNGGDCGAKIMHHLHQEYNLQDIAIELIAETAEIAGPWAPPQDYEVEYLAGGETVTLTVDYDLVYNETLDLVVRGKVANWYHTEELVCTTTALREAYFGLIDEASCRTQHRGLVEGNWSAVVFGRAFFEQEPATGNFGPRTATADIFSTFIEETGHAWQVVRTPGLPVADVVNGEGAETEYNKGVENQVKVYILQIPENILMMSVEQRSNFCTQIQPGAYAGGIPHEDLTSPDGWPHYELWPLEETTVSYCGDLIND